MFPDLILRPEFTVLSLFSAAFLGKNDISFIHKAGIKQCTMIDIDLDKLIQMNKLFNYSYVCEDALKVIDNCSERFDVVISDQFTNMNKDVWQRYDKLKQITSKYLIIGVSGSFMKEYKLPEGELYKRSENYGGVYWHVTVL